MRQETVFSAKSRHTAEVDLVPADAREGNDQYRAYYENQHGEQLIFVYDRNTHQGVLYHGDMDWQPQQVREEGGVIMISAILNALEREWLSVCWKTATAFDKSRHSSPQV